MKRWIVSTLAVLALAASVQAQPQIGKPPATSRPTVSPYLNLNRGGFGAAIDYYGIVRPQLETQKALTNLQQQYQGLQGGAGGAGGDDGAMPTGGITTGGIGGFFNYSHYFPLYQRGGAFGAGFAGTNTGGAGLGGGLGGGLGSAGFVAPGIRR